MPNVVGLFWLSYVFLIVPAGVLFAIDWMFA